MVEGLAAGLLSVGQGLTLLWDTGKGVSQVALGAGGLASPKVTPQS